MFFRYFCLLYKNNLKNNEAKNRVFFGPSDKAPRSVRWMGGRTRGHAEGGTSRGEAVRTPWCWCERLAMSALRGFWKWGGV